jgi:glycosyltransferase involved in cell wall biosynthesis
MPSSDTSDPTVSVIVPAYNSAPFIEATLRSALDQTFRDLELIVVDDGSTDSTSDLVRRVAATDERVVLIQQENRGLAAARNRGIGIARGRLIAFLDNDDLWLPEKLALQVELADTRPEVGAVSCYSTLIDERGRCLGWRYGGAADGHVYAEMLEWDMVSGGSVALVRRDALDAVGPFDESNSIRSDWDMWIRLARKYPFATVPRILVGYTRREQGMSGNHEAMAEGGRRLLAKLMHDDPAFARSRLRFYEARDLFAVACFCTVDGHVEPAWRYIAKSLGRSPGAILLRPRRWALVAILVMQTVLPDRIYGAALGRLCRSAFGLTRGQPFYDIDARVPAP